MHRRPISEEPSFQFLDSYSIDNPVIPGGRARGEASASGERVKPSFQLPAVVVIAVDDNQNPICGWQPVGVSAQPVRETRQKVQLALMHVYLERYRAENPW